MHFNYCRTFAPDAEPARVDGAAAIGRWLRQRTVHGPVRGSRGKATIVRAATGAMRVQYPTKLLREYPVLSWRGRRERQDGNLRRALLLRQDGGRVSSLRAARVCCAR